MAQILGSAQVQPASLSICTGSLWVSWLTHSAWKNLNREVKLQFSITDWMKKKKKLNELDASLILFFFMYSASPKQVSMPKNLCI